MNISKAKIKLIHSLDSKKGRRESGLFIAEGPKVVGDLLELMPARLIIATTDWLEANNDRINDTETIEVSDEELKKASLLQHPQKVLALFPILNNTEKDDCHLAALLTDKDKAGKQKLTIALDGVQDPGNLGTIIRIADWFGITDIICSHDTVDAFSPKVVQATMGSIARVHIHHADLENLIKTLPTDFPVYGTFLNGSDLYDKPLSVGGIIIMGNEGKGISQPVKALVNHRLLIPNYPKGRKTADSLNVAIATAITCAEFRRRI